MCIQGKKFHTYLYGRSFTITDHKLLLGLFKEHQAIPAHASALIRRWALTPASYEYNLQFRNSTAHSNADSLSRLPLTKIPVSVPYPPKIVLLMDHLERPITIQCYLVYYSSCWPDVCDNDELKPYWSRKLELAAQQGCLTWGNRVVVPPSLQQKILRQLHEIHLGISRMKSFRENICMVVRV